MSAAGRPLRVWRRGRDVARLVALPDPSPVSCAGQLDYLRLDGSVRRSVRIIIDPLDGMDAYDELTRAADLMAQADGYHPEGP